MAIPREKGQFVQVGTPHLIPEIDGSFLSVDGMVDFDALLLQEDYPELFAVLGLTYNKVGDNNATQFRTPELANWGLTNDPGGTNKWMIRF